VSCPVINVSAFSKYLLSLLDFHNHFRVVALSFIDSYSPGAFYAVQLVADLINFCVTTSRSPRFSSFPWRHV
jgi:hypothetical protein